jgi:tRNA threonylcarbamoyl adenosine modification protein TsaD
VRVLGLESSCDETAAAIVEDGRRVIAEVVASQDEVHERYGGVVPELAARAHVVNVVPVLRTALARAGASLADVDAVAVTAGPGLIGALLIALQTGKAIAWARGLPLVGVHHLHGHLSAVFLDEDPPPLPHLALIVSGGHTSLCRVEAHGVVVELGSTRDDAAGEAFDKGAKLLGLGYPGGAVIDRLAQAGDPRAIDFPRGMIGDHTGADFSFSGLKTALLHHVRGRGPARGAGAGRRVRQLPGGDRRRPGQEDPAPGAPRAAGPRPDLRRRGGQPLAARGADPGRRRGRFRGARTAASALHRQRGDDRRGGLLPAGARRARRRRPRCARELAAGSTRRRVSDANREGWVPCWLCQQGGDEEPPWR